MLVGTRCNAEETVLRIDGIQSAVLARLHPCDIVADSEYLVAVLLVALRRDQHSQIGLTAGRRESSSDILGFAVRLLNAQDQHVLSHPALVLALEGSNMQTTNEIVGGFAQILESLYAHTSHDVHVQNNINRVSQLNANLSQRRTDRAHGVRDHVHGSALHYAVIQRDELCLHLFRIHPVVGRASAFLGLGADESTIFYTCNVVRESTVVQTARQLLRIQLVHLVMVAFRQRSYFFCQGIQLFLRAVDPYDLFRLCQSDHFVNPLQYIFIVCQCHWFYLLNSRRNLNCFPGDFSQSPFTIYYTQIRRTCQAFSEKSCQYSECVHE